MAQTPRVAISAQDRKAGFAFLHALSSMKDVTEALNILRGKEDELQERAEAEAKSKIQEIAAELGVDLNKLFNRSSVGVVYKYQNPADPEQKWIGKGKPPKWFRDAKERGIAPEDMLIQKKAKAPAEAA